MDEKRILCKSTFKHYSIVIKQICYPKSYLYWWLQTDLGFGCAVQNNTKNLLAMRYSKSQAKQSDHRMTSNTPKTLTNVIDTVE